MVTDESGVKKARYDYAPFGEEVTRESRGESTLFPGSLYPKAGEGPEQRFTGKERDAETGLDYFGARYMSAAQGRFTSPDLPFADQRASDPQSWNLYSYGRNNPLRFTDPTGRCVVDGETHGWLWCAAHSIGLTQTVKEQADAARQSLSQMRGFTIDGKSPAEIAKSGTNQQVISASRQATEFFVGIALKEFSRICPEGVDCGVMPFVLGRPVFRGGSSMVARPGIDVKVGTDGLVHPGRGISVNLDPTKLERFGGGRQVLSIPDVSIPEELEVVQRGANAAHYEIAPKQPMTLQRYQELLNQVVLKE